MLQWLHESFEEIIRSPWGFYWRAICWCFRKKINQTELQNEELMEVGKIRTMSFFEIVMLIWFELTEEIPLAMIPTMPEAKR